MFLHDILSLADDQGSGNDLLKKIGSNITLKSGIISSMDRLYNDSSVIVTTPAQQHPLTMSVSTLIVDRAVPVSGGEALIQSSILSWTDTNQDGRISGGESLGRYTVMARDTLGKGEIMVLSDPSLFINAMNELEKNTGNAQFIMNVLQYHPDVYIDETQSRTANTSWLHQELRSVQQNQVTITILVFILFILIGTGFMIRFPQLKQEYPVDQNENETEGMD